MSAAEYRECAQAIKDGGAEIPTWLLFGLTLDDVTDVSSGLSDLGSNSPDRETEEERNTRRNVVQILRNHADSMDVSFPANSAPGNPPSDISTLRTDKWAARTTEEALERLLQHLNQRDKDKASGQGQAPTQPSSSDGREK